MPNPRQLALIIALAAFALRERARRRVAERFGAAAFESLLSAIDANDAATGNHVRRVATYSIELAAAAGYDESVRREVEHVALFHDIGKISAALFDIIHDDHSLSDSDRAAIATHPQRGADVLRPLQRFYPYLGDGVLAHHERWDGTGYPRRLSGEQIPIHARIVAIADSFDAITRARSYSAGRSLESGREAIWRGRGTQFDPQLVDLFLSPRVQACVLRTHESADVDPDIPRPGQRNERRSQVPETSAPEVAFRWRGSGENEAPAT